MALNILSPQFGARVFSSSSQERAHTLLLDDIKQMWVSSSKLPIEIIFDLSQIQVDYEFITQIGILCWHDYSSNPRQILVQTMDGDQWVDWATLHLNLQGGLQTFDITAIPFAVTHVKFIVFETYGSSKTYMNQVMFLAPVVEVPEGIDEKVKVVEEAF